MNWTEYVNRLVAGCREAGVPSSAAFELTPLCNFSCNMCYIRLTPDQARLQGEALTADEWLRVAEQARRLGVLGLEVTGGEAVTRPDFPALYEALIRMGYLITLRTNGYLLRGGILDLLKRYRPLSVCVTLYGASDETYRRVCGVDDGFSVVTENVLALREAGIAPRLTVTMTKDNFGDRAELTRWAAEHGFYIAFFGGLINPIRGAKRSVGHLRVDCGDGAIPIDEAPDRAVPDREKYAPPFSMCRSFGTKFCVTWDGRMTLCNCLPSIWTDVRSQGVEGAFRSLYGRLNAVKRPPECADCPYIDYCGCCPARFYSETGDHEKTCDDLCRMAKIHYTLSKSDARSGESGADRRPTMKERDGLNED